MLLDDLVGVIETLKGRIATHGATLRENETRTRMALIDPLLQALGWDTSDPTVVTPEYQTGGKADYALLDSNGKPAAVIEAKHLGEPIGRHQQQMFSYAVMEVIQYASLTDGDQWEIYKVFADSPSERRILNLSIADTPAHEAALKLLLLWRPNLASGQPVAANAPVLVTLPDSPPEPDPAPAPVAPDSGNWISVASVETRKGYKPKAVRFSGGETKAIEYWWQVLAEVAEWLVKHERLAAEDCPIHGLGFINSAPVSPSGGQFHRHRQISGGLYLNVNLNSATIVDHSKRLLTHFGVDLDTVELRFE